MFLTKRSLNDQKEILRNHNHVHMKFVRILMTVLGIWPVKLTGYKLKLYNTYFYLSFAYYILYDISQAAMVFVAQGDFLAAARNLGVIIVFIINIYKVLICRSPALQKIIQEIEIKEFLILRDDDEKIKKIYHHHVRSAFLSGLFYVAFGTVAILLYVVTPIVKNKLEIADEFGHKTKYLIFSSWFPFDTNENYLAAFTIQLISGFYGYAYVVYAGAFLFCLLKYVIGQIQVLQHVLRNFNDYVTDYDRKNKPFSVKNPQEILAKVCIEEHQYLISLVERLDKSIKTFMLMEFLISSFQLSLVVYEILQSSGFGIQRISVLAYLFTICTQLFLFYWNAHQIIIQSVEIAQAVFECEWFVLDKKVQEMLMFIMMRAQKPLGISIGPIYKVRIESLIAIFKALYSYVALIQK